MRLAKAKAARGADMTASIVVTLSFWVVTSRVVYESSSRIALLASLLGRLRGHRVQLSWQNMIGFVKLKPRSLRPSTRCIRLLNSFQADVFRKLYKQSVSPSQL
jgi:hypothetical protein